MPDWKKLVEGIKIDDARLGYRTELLKKNMLLHQSDQVFKRVEEDYRHLISAFNQEPDSHKQPDIDLTPVEPTLRIPVANISQESSRKIDEKLVLGPYLKEIAAANVKLIQHLENALKHVSKLEMELENFKGSDFQRLAHSIHSLFTMLQVEREAVLQEKLKTALLRKNTRRLAKNVSKISRLLPNNFPNFISNYTDTSNVRVCHRAFGQLNNREIAMNAVIRLQDEQIQRYDHYVTRLHEEIKNWINPGEPIPQPNIFDSDSSNSVIAAIRLKIEQDCQRSRSEDALKAKLGSKLEEIKVKYSKSRRNEEMLQLENKLLRTVILDFNKLQRNESFRDQAKVCDAYVG